MCAGYAGPLRDHAIELAENVVFMERKLARTRRDAKDQPLVVPYDNGGGQRGLRKNPIFDAYIDMVRQYNRSLSSLNELLGTSYAADPEANRFARFAGGGS